MTLDQLHKNGDAMSALRAFFTHPQFAAIRIAFVSHSPKGDDKVECSTEVAHGQYLGTRYVFNKIEEMVTVPAAQPTPPRKSVGEDPDLASRKPTR